jgi:L-asparaginase II
MANPIIVEVTRGGIVESRHRGAYSICDAAGEELAAAGDTSQAIFPRSAIKAFQALAMVEAGVADRFDFSAAEISLACSSHAGEPKHVETAHSMLRKIGLVEADYACGPHWPSNEAAARELARAQDHPGQVHNNCSGKHAGMLGLAVLLEAPREGYIKRDHPVQRAVGRVISKMCDVDVDTVPCGIDGCSVPTWAIPLKSLAKGFARFATGEGLSTERQAACRRIIAAVRAYPFMVAGTGRFCTDVMQAVPEVFVKTGAEGVFCGCVPASGIGIALKCDDGGTRAAECLMAHLLARHAGLDADSAAALQRFVRVVLVNRAGLDVGEVRVCSALS